MSVLESLILGVIAGALMVYAWLEPRMAELTQTIDDLLEETEDLAAERDAFRWHLDQAIAEDDRRAQAMALHPAGGRHVSWGSDKPALRIVNGGNDFTHPSAQRSYPA